MTEGSQEKDNGDNITKIREKVLSERILNRVKKERSRKFLFDNSDYQDWKYLTDPKIVNQFRNIFTQTGILREKEPLLEDLQYENVQGPVGEYDYTAIFMFENESTKYLVHFDSDSSRFFVVTEN